MEAKGFYDSIVAHARDVIRLSELQSQHIELVDVGHHSENVDFPEKVEADIIKTSLKTAKAVQDHNVNVITDYIRENLESEIRTPEFYRSLREQMEFSEGLSIGSIFNGVKNGVGWVVDQTAAILANVWKAFQAAYNLIINAIDSQLSVLFEWFKKRLEECLGYIADLIMKPIVNMLNLALDVINTSWDSMSAGVMVLVNQIISTVVRGLKTCGDAIMDVVKVLYSALYEVFGGFIEAFIEMIKIVKFIFESVLMLLKPEFWASLVGGDISNYIYVAIILVCGWLLLLAVGPLNSRHKLVSISKKYDFNGMATDIDVIEKIDLNILQRVANESSKKYIEENKLKYNL